MRKGKIAALILSLLIATVFFAGCSKSESSYDNVESLSSSYSKKEDFSDQDSILYNNYTNTGSNGSTEKTESETGTDNESYFERKIIKTVTINGETKEFDAVDIKIDSYIGKYGGYIETSTFSGKSLSSKSKYYSRSASYTIRVPAENLDAFLTELGGAINIVNSNSSVDDISAQYYDILSRLNTLAAEKEALLAMYDKASTIDSMLQIQKQLYDVIEEIEANTTKLNYYKNKVSYSTLYLNISEVIEYTDLKTEPATFGERISEAFTTSWKNFANGCKNFAVGFVYAFPTLLVIFAIFGGIGLIIYFVVRKPKKNTVHLKDSEKK